MSNLSPAQIQERRDAARARWDRARDAAVVAAGGVGGGAAVAGILSHASATLRTKGIADKNEALQPLRAAFRRHRDQQALINARAAKTKTGIRSERNFLSTASRAYDIKFRAASAAARALAQHRAANSDVYFDSTSGDTERVPTDPVGEAKLSEKAGILGADERERFKALAVDLKANGRKPKKVMRPGWVHRPKVESFTRKTRGKPELSLSHSSRKVIEEMLAGDADERARQGNDLSVFHDLGIKSIQDLENYFRRLPPSDRSGFTSFLRGEANLPNVKLVRPKRPSEVTNTIRVVPAHEVTVPGYPAPPVRQSIRAELLSDITARHAHKTLQDGQRAEAEMTSAKAIAAAAGKALPFLRPSSNVRRGILGTGIAAGVLAGAFAAAKLKQALDQPTAQNLQKVAGAENATRHPLNKAKPDDSAGDENDDRQGPTPRKRQTTASRLIAAADNVEADLAAGVARALAGWKDAVTPESVASPNAPGALFDQLDEPLMTGMEPMDRATADGLVAPSRIQRPPEDDSGDGKPSRRLLHFGFNIRSNAVKTYAQQYRYNRVREITDAQRKNIRQIIIQATDKADPPAVIARKIRDVVGLTAYQAGIVANYRLALEAGDPRAMSYALRDRRYDKTIQKAIENKTPLTADQVDKMVDVYQRRFIAHRAMTIARTEAIRAANNGHVKTVTDFLDAHPDYTVAKTWISTEDEKTRPDHVGLHRQTVIGMQTPFVCDSGEQIRWPHDPKAAAKEVINCFHPDTIIQGNVLLATRAHYSGPMREITTRSGAKLTVTPQHPVATSKGFAGAISLRNGDKLIRYVSDKKGSVDSSVSDNEYNKPTAIKDIFDALGQKGRSGGVKVGSHDFHGDGIFCDGQIDIVCADRELMVAIQATRQEFADQIDLTVSHTKKPGLKRNSALFPLVDAMEAASRRSVCASNLPSDAPWIGLNFLPLQELGLRLTPQFDAALQESLCKDTSCKTGFFGELFQRHASFVTANQIRNIGYLQPRHNAGFVYAPQFDALVAERPGEGAWMNSVFNAEFNDRSATLIKPNKIVEIRNDGLFKSQRFGSASYLDAALLKPAGEDFVGESVFLSDLRERNPTLIELDEIVEIRDFHYTGHVYDVQTTSKCVFAQDLLASNCRCSLMTVLIPRSAAAKHGPAAYGTPYPNFWDGPKPVYDIDDPDQLFEGATTA